MKKAIILLLLGLSISIAALNFSPAFAHKTITQGQFNIGAGWGTEPPLVGELNTIVLEVTRASDGQPVINALAQVNSDIRKGGEIKSLNFVPQEQPGIYEAQLIPSQTGQYTVAFNGTVAGQAINGQIEIENVENTQRLEFPPAGSSGGNNNALSQEMLGQVQAVITDLTTLVQQANTTGTEAKQAAQAATDSAEGLKAAADRAYLFGIIAVGVGVAGIALGAIALSRREKIQAHA